MVPEDLPYAPSLSWRIASTATIAITGFLAKAFVRVACTTEVHGLDEFLKLLDERKDVDGRQRGLITGK
jgi:monolysocardiolipin acyltransferase